MRAYITICDIYYYDICVLLIILLRNRTTRTSTFGDQVRRTRRLGIPTRRQTAIFCRCNCCPRAGRVSGAWTRGRLTTVQPWRFRRSMSWVFVPWRRRLSGSLWWKADGRLFSLIYRFLRGRSQTRHTIPQTAHTN